MDPDLSRRIAKAVQIMTLLGLNIDDRFAMAHRVEQADDFSALPESDRRAILAAEKIAKSGLSIADILALKDDNQLSP